MSCTYSLQSQTVAPRKATLRIAPKPEANTGELVLRKNSATPVPWSPPLLAFESEQDAQYFELFSTQTAYDLLPSIERQTLRRVFLQTCVSQPSVRHCVVALGALDKTSRSSITRPGENGSSIARQHYRHALKTYSTALHLMKNVSPAHHLRTALLNCLLTACFEGWRGDQRLSLLQISTSAALLREWTQQHTIKKLNILPAENVLESSLVRLITRLSAQLVTSLGNKARSVEESDTSIAVFDMPRVFNDFGEAVYYHGVLSKRLLRFIANGPKVESTRHVHPGRVYRGSALTPEVRKEEQNLERLSSEWLKAFSDFKKHNPPADCETTSTWLTMEIQVIGGYLGILQAYCEDELVYDGSMNDWNIFGKVIAISERLLGFSPSIPTSTPKFSFDIGVVIFLWWCGLKCRQPLVRRRAINLLLSYPRREGLYDSCMVGRISQYVMEVEERFMDVKGFVPGWARLSMFYYRPNYDDHTVEVECPQRVSEWSEDVVRHKKTLRW